MRNRRAGFTLIELLVVIAIIGILASIILVAVGSARSKANDAKRIADIRDIQSALELYANGNGYLYPTSLSALTPVYLSSIPTDPSTGSQYVYAAIGTGVCASGAKDYHLGAVLQNTNNPALLTAADSNMKSSTCTGSANFYGVSVGCSAITQGTKQPGGNQNCYDVCSTLTDC